MCAAVGWGWVHDNAEWKGRDHLLRRLQFLSLGEMVVAWARRQWPFRKKRSD